jgi:predicted glycosyltransferase
MRVWIDLTNSPHVLVMRPVVDTLRADGHEVRVTARDFAQTLELLERFQIPHVAIGRHRGERRAAKAAGLLLRSGALIRWALRQRSPYGWRHLPGAGFDLALGHGSNDITVAAASLGIPCSTMFDYEFASVQHQVNCRLANAVVVPDAIPASRLYGFGARGKIAAYPGLKEEYYLADFEPAAAVLEELALEPDRPLVVVRTPPELALYHRFASEVFDAVLARLHTAAREQHAQVLVLARTPAQRARLGRFDEFTLPERALDAQSLIAYADLVISAGGTMNREAVALGTPVITTFQGRLGAVDEGLVREGRLRRLADASDLDAVLEGLPSRGQARRAAREANGQSRPRIRRDPRVLVELLLTPLGRA